MVSLLTALTLLTVLSQPAPTCSETPEAVLRARLTVASGPFESAAPVIREVVEEVWRNEGLTIVWPDAPVENAWDGIDVWIAVTFGVSSTAGKGAMGFVRFHDGVPSPLLQISIDVALAWARHHHAAAFKVSPASISPMEMLPVVGRALGYAAAHEVGHFVLASTAHASTGLMRANYSRPSDVWTPSAWQLDAGSRATLSERLRRRCGCASGC
jgi:hypothetical protein